MMRGREEGFRGREGGKGGGKWDMGEGSGDWLPLSTTTLLSRISNVTTGKG